MLNKKIPDGFITANLRAGYGVEDIGLKLRKIGVDVTNDNVRVIVRHWQNTGQIGKVLGLKTKKTAPYAYQVAMESEQDE